MKLSEKYLKEQLPHDGMGFLQAVSMEKLKLYAEICSLEALQTLLVNNPETFSQDRYIDKLSEIVNALEEIKTQQNIS